MNMERDLLVKLLGQYNTTFKLTEVEALLAGEPLPTNASPTLLDIEQSLSSMDESTFRVDRNTISSDNVE